MPSGGDGFYYFFVYLTADGSEFAYFEIEVNGQPVCTATSDIRDLSSNSEEATSCSVVTYATAGRGKSRSY